MIRKLALCSAVACFVISGVGMSHEGPRSSDAQIAHIAYTAGQIDIDAGKQALSKSTNKVVRAFAEEMVRDHSAVNNQALALVKKLGVTPEANATSSALSAHADEQMRKLGTLKGATFDKAYVQNEIIFHKTVNGALSGTLIPDAHNSELKSLLETGLTLFQEHQKHAEHLARDIR